MLEVKETKWNEGMNKPEYIKEISQITNFTQKDVQAVLNAFVDIAEREMIMNGVFYFPGLPIVTRSVRTSVKRYQPDIDKTLLYPETCFLTAKVPANVKKLHREAFRHQNNAINGTSDENWWEPYVFCDGDWRKK